MNDAARDELWRQGIILVFSLATIGIMYFVNDPDAWREWKMRAALRTKRIAQTLADKSQDIADRAATLYQREQP